jgi:hypothetical protein
VAFSAIAVAQTATTSLQGQVADPQGAAIAGAKVVLTNAGTGASRSDATSATGGYLFASLPPGSYQLRIEAPGFRTYLQENLRLMVDSPMRLNVSLTIGATQEVVEVTAAAERLNTIDASVGNAFAESQIKQLPLEARNVVGLLSLQPGTVFLPIDSTKDTTNDPRSGSISGGHADQTNVTMDGVDVNDSENGYAYTSVLRATLDSVQEFRVTTTNYGAEQGRSSGAQVSLVTKSGTNTPHGALYWYHRNTAFSSNEFFNKLSQYQDAEQFGTPVHNVPPKLQKHIYGASFGFAPIKDRLFLFGNFENLRLSAQQAVERYVPSSTMRDGILVYPCANAADCPGGTVQGFTASHPIPSGWSGLGPDTLAALDPLHIGPSVAASTYFQQFPVSNSTGRDGSFISGVGVIGNITGYRFGAPVKNDWWTYIARADFNVDRSGKHQLMWRGNLQNDREDAQPRYCFQGQCTSPLNVTARNNRGMMAGYTAAFTSRLVNNFRYGYTRIGGRQAGRLNSSYVSFRFIDDTSGFDVSGSEASGRIVPTHNLLDDVTWNIGRHTLQFGANLRYTRVQTNTNVNSFPYVITNGSWVSGNGKIYIPGRYTCPYAVCDSVPAVNTDSYASYADSWIDILGVLSESDATYNYDRSGNLIPFGVPIRRRWATNGYEFYVQDNIKIKSNFNIVAGLRWSYTSPPWETNGLQVAPDRPLGDWFNQRAQYMAQGRPASDLPLINFNLAGPANNSSLGFYNKQYNNWAPRLAFTYSPEWDNGWLQKLSGGAGKTVIRGGYGIVYDQIGLGLAYNFDSVGAFGLASPVSSPWHGHSEDDPNVRFVDLQTVPNTLPEPVPGGFPFQPPTAAGAINSSLDSRIRTPYSQMFNFFIGRQLPWKTSLELGYVGRRASHVLVRRDLAMPLNLVDPTSKTDYFTAARQLIDGLAAVGQDWTQVGAIPYWENLFPTAAESYNAAYGADYGYVTNNTQAVGFDYSGLEGDWTTGLYSLDEFCDPACSKLGPFSYFDPQWDALGALSSVGRSNYNALQISFRKQYSHGLQFDLNYTYSKSMDHSSAVERGSNWTDFGPGGYSDFLINSWNPKQSYGTSDFDIRHQINFNYVADLPFGKGRKLGNGAHGFVDALIGGWQTTGILRINSALPFDILNCRSCWPTNWQLQGNTQYTDLAAVKGLLGHKLNVVAGKPSPFTDPLKVLSLLRRSYPGEGGQKNRLRGDGYFTWDVSVGKSFKMPYKESHYLKFRWDIFNLTNTARFDVASLLVVPDFASTFGSYNSVYSGCDGAAGRCMQVSLRYEF